MMKDFCSSRDLVKKIKVQCERWRYLRKNIIDVQMGPISKYNVMMSAAFYETQVDICGTFKAYSMHHKRRRTIKFRLTVYYCVPTSTTSLKVMDHYSTQSIIQLFILFSYEFGYPKFMLIDEGSQLVKGCQTIQLPVFFYHITYVFQSESTLYSCLNVKELFARNWGDI